MSEPLRLLSVHAHPDDESSKGAATVARYHHEGMHTVLVCCTGGEAGDILNPAMDRPEVRERLEEVRREELRRAAGIIGYDEVVMLGYRDSGMAGTPANDDPRCFARAPLVEAVGALVGVIRRARPHVVLTYHEDQRSYPHPDHLRVHEVSAAAFDAAGDAGAYPQAGEPWQPQKLYYHVWSRRRMLAMHDKFVELGLSSPFDRSRLDRSNDPDVVTTRVEVAEWADVPLDALRAHATQVEPASPFWFGLPREVAREVYPYEEYTLAKSLVAGDPPRGEWETDLFDGLRPPVEGAGAPATGAAGPGACRL